MSAITLFINRFSGQAVGELPLLYPAGAESLTLGGYRWRIHRITDEIRNGSIIRTVWLERGE